MSRFGDFDEDEQNFEYEDEYSDENGHHEHEAMMSATIPADLMNRWKESEVELEARKINFAILQQAVTMLEKSWMWRFRSLEARIRMICDTYYAMADLITSDD